MWQWYSDMQMETSYCLRRSEEEQESLLQIGKISSNSSGMKFIRRWSLGNSHAKEPQRCWQILKTSLRPLLVNLIRSKPANFAVIKRRTLNPQLARRRGPRMFHLKTKFKMNRKLTNQVYPSAIIQEISLELLHLNSSCSSNRS